jgi:hypothetical protein
MINEQTPLQTAIDDAKFALEERRRLIIKGSHFYPIKELTLPILVAAAQRTQELEQKLNDFEAMKVRVKKLENDIDGFRDNLPKCGSCAENIVCGSHMHPHDEDCVYTQLSQYKTSYKEAVEALSKYSIAHGGKEKGGRYWTLEDAEAIRESILSSPLAQQIRKEGV